MMSLEVMELFSALESNHQKEVEEVKHKFHEQFNITRESWLLNVMYDYFMSTGSQRAVEIIVAVREPHDKYLFDRLGDGLRSANRIQALALLGHVVKRQPTWLIKITNHFLLKELIKILKSENEITTIISAVLVLCLLLTIIPALISPFLPDIFEGFSRLAAWNTSQQNRVPQIQLFHLQTSIYVLFVQLFSMYPCSFVAFMKQQYSSSDNNLVFTHTIKPMLETMRMHPGLIVSTNDVETSTNRWKKMEQHDVVMECTKYTLLENGDRNYQNPSSWVNAGQCFSPALEKLKQSVGATGDVVSVNSIRNKELWSPTLTCGEFCKETSNSMPTTPNIQTYYKTSIFNHNEHSPPEAAVEATPETTPIRDVVYQQSRLPSLNSTVVRALNSFGLDNLSRRNSSTPNSQPSSPLKKEGFVFPPEDIQSQALIRRVDRMLMERNQVPDTSKEENFISSESKPISTQIQPTFSENLQTGDEDIIECDQQSNGSPCQTHEGGLHMPDSNELKEFVNSVRTRRRYKSQCTPEKTTNDAEQSTDHFIDRDPEVALLSVRRANSCPEMKKTNGSSISSGTSPLQEETEDEHYADDVNISNGHTIDVPIHNEIKDKHVFSVQTVSTQTEPILPYEHLFYSIFPAYNDPHNNCKSQQNTPDCQEDESLSIVEKYVRTSAIIHNHRHTAQTSNDVETLKDQILLLTLQLQFERNRREVHAERNRRLLGKSRNSRALDEHNSALKDQVLMLQVELENMTIGFEKFKQNSSKQVKELKDSVIHWQTECLKYQEETKEAKNNCLSIEQLYNGERIKTAEITKLLSDTNAELFNTKSELTIVQAEANTSKELRNTVINMQRELVMCGEMQSRQRDVVTHVNTLRYDAANATLSQESYKHQLNKLQEMLSLKSALLEATNTRVVDLELKLNTKNTCMQNDKREIELLKEKYHKELSDLKKECKILKEKQCRYEENKEEEESKKKFLEELAKLGSDVAAVDSNTSINEQETVFRINLMKENDDICSDVSVLNTTPK